MVNIAVTPGEAYDRHTILYLKFTHAKSDIAKSGKLMAELAELAEGLSTLPAMSTDTGATELQRLYDALLDVNSKLWDCEDVIRAPEQVPGYEWLATAKQIPVLNDQRNSIKREIDALYGAPRSEIKIYKDTK